MTVFLCSYRLPCSALQQRSTLVHRQLAEEELLPLVVEQRQHQHLLLAAGSARPLQQLEGLALLLLGAPLLSVVVEVSVHPLLQLQVALAHLLHQLLEHPRQRQLHRRLVVSSQYIHTSSQLISD